MTPCNDSHENNSSEPSGRTLRHAFGKKKQEKKQKRNSHQLSSLSEQNQTQAPLFGCVCFLGEAYPPATDMSRPGGARSQAPAKSTRLSRLRRISAELAHTSAPRADSDDSDDSDDSAYPMEQSSGCPGSSESSNGPMDYFFLPDLRKG